MEESEIKIPGINSESALELLEGDTDIYLALLESFTESTPDILDSLRNVNKENLQEYAVNVHGLKGICAGIGAVEASAKAKQFELLAKAGDLPGVAAGNADLLKTVEKLIDDIKSWQNSNSK